MLRSRLHGALLNETAPEKTRIACGFLHRRQCLVPTARGWLAFFAGAALLVLILICEINPFLSVTDQVPADVLVVEGWAPDYAMEAAVTEFKNHHYQKIYVTGGPIDQGAPLSDYKTYAELGAAVLLKLGLSTNEVQAVSAPWVRQDRTYTSAITLQAWWREHQVSPTKINLLTVGPHARRSRLLFEKALGKNVGVGVISIPGKDFDEGHWWRSSGGVRVVIGETLAYCYARFLFHP